MTGDVGGDIRSRRRNRRNDDRIERDKQGTLTQVSRGRIDACRCNTAG